MQPEAANLTLDSQIVRPLKHVSPTPRCDLVVFHKTHGEEGHAFVAILGPDEKLPVLARAFYRGKLVAYAVTRETHRRHELTREVTTWNQSGKFMLHCTLTLRVADPKAVVEQLRSDPLRQLENDAA